MSDEVLKLLMEAVVASSLAIAVVLIMRVPLRKFFGARVAYTIWCLVPLALLAVLVPAQDVVVTVVSQTQTISAAPTEIAVAAPTSTPTSEKVSSSDFFLLLWAIGIAMCAFWFSRQQKKFIGSLGVLNPCNEKVFLSENNDQGPAVIGVLQPRIVLPSDFNQRYTREEQDLVLMHEQIHVARGDTRVNLVVALLRCLFWFNPLLHWADARFRFDQELSTDANVLSKFPSARKSYADAMLKTQMATIGLPVACHWQAHHPLKERILMLKKSSPGKMFRMLGFGLVTVLCLGGAFAAWSTQPANIIARQADASLQYEIRIDSKIDHVDLSRIKLREVPGKPVAVSNGKGVRDWSYEFTITPINADYVLVKSKILFGGVLLSEPSLKVAMKKNASIAVMTKDGSSHLTLNLVVTELRNGKPSPNAEFGDTRDALLDTDHFIQGRSGKQEIFSERQLRAQTTTAVDDDEIATPAKMLPGSVFQKHIIDGKNAGKKIVRFKVNVDEKGFVMGLDPLDNFESDSSSVIHQAVDLLMKEKYQPAIGKNGKPVPSNITVELYDNFRDIPPVN